MKTRKRELLVVLSLIISVAFTFLGCPPRDGPPDEGGNGDGGGEPPQQLQYEIRLSFPHEYGEVTVNPASHMATRGDRVTVTLKPSAGYEPWGLLVHNASFFGLELTPAVISNVYEYTFTMDASIVTVIVNFVPLLTAITDWTALIMPATDWKYMDALNTLIKKAPDPSVRAVTDAETRLAGNARPNPDVGLGGAFETGTAPNLIRRRYESSPYVPGVIRTKIRNADLKEWFPTIQRWPSESIDKGSELILYQYFNPANTPITPYSTADNTSLSDTLGTDLTILYYVEEDNPTIPAPVAGTGWNVGGRAAVTSVNNNALFNNYLGPNLDVVQEILLLFNVGIANGFPVDYRLWLWPVAQYTLVHENGASTSTTVTLQDYEYSEAGDGAGVNPSAWTARGPAKTLRAGNSQVTGLVGRADIPAGYTPPARPVAPATPAPGNIGRRAKEVMVEVSTTRTGVVIGVYTSSGSIVRDVYGDNLNYIQAGVNGYFCPDSAQYTIRVWPSTPPTGL